MNRNSIVYAGDEIIESTQFDVTWEQVRKARGHALSNTDWRAVKDRTMSQAWKDYRQALRDLPQNFESANDAVDNWPQPPE